VAVTLQAAPLAVARVVREGLPPYEESGPLYRVEGDGCDQLRPGRVLLPVRPREPRSLGQLEVVRASAGFILARQLKPGATYPMKGDLIVPREPLRTLPELPTSGQPLPVPPPAAAHREPIYFLPEEAALTPGAKAKLKAWAATWGRGGRWVLDLAGEAPPPLSGARLEALREELHRLGVAKVETGPAEAAPPGPYPAVFVVFNPS
jgi:hypothetical protein